MRQKYFSNGLRRLDTACIASPSPHNADIDARNTKVLSSPSPILMTIPSSLSSLDKSFENEPSIELKRYFFTSASQQTRRI